MAVEDFLTAWHFMRGRETMESDANCILRMTFVTARVKLCLILRVVWWEERTHKDFFPQRIYTHTHNKAHCEKSQTNFIDLFCLPPTVHTHICLCLLFFIFISISRLESWKTQCQRKCFLVLSLHPWSASTLNPEKSIFLCKRIMMLRFPFSRAATQPQTTTPPSQKPPTPSVEHLPFATHILT